MIILPDTDSELRGYLERLGDAVLDYQMLQGFLFAVACSPESVEPSEWFELVWLNEEPQFDTEDEAKHFFGLLRHVFTDIEQAIERGRYLPMSCPGTILEQQNLARWSEGFLFAHLYLEELWDMALADLASDELDEAVNTVFNLSRTFVEIFQDVQLSFDGEVDGVEMTREQLQNAYQWFDESLSLYAKVALLWEEFNTVMDAEQLFLALEPVGRDEPCPCGSGEIFAKCCLH